MILHTDTDNYRKVRLYPHNWWRLCLLRGYPLQLHQFDQRFQLETLYSQADGCWRTSK